MDAFKKSLAEKVFVKFQNLKPRILTFEFNFEFEPKKRVPNLISFLIIFHFEFLGLFKRSMQMHTVLFFDDILLLFIAIIIYHQGFDKK